MPCGGGGASYQQKEFRIRNDDGNESGASWMYSLNTDGDVKANKIFRVRFTIKNTTGSMGGGGGSEADGFKLQASINSGAYSDISSSSACQYANSSYITNHENTTQQIGSGSFTAGDMVETLATDIITFYAYTETEFEWVLSLDSAQLADGDTVKLRIVEDGGATCSTYTQYPTVTCRYVSDLMLGFHF